ncbi:MAG: hypothetical protein WC979_00370 [Candidatus Pacearchaeota archaeon]|jgi:hypothetical protein|nr:hypothetical protein [Clostridia bacterium]
MKNETNDDWVLTKSGRPLYKLSGEDLGDIWFAYNKKNHLKDFLEKNPAVTLGSMRAKSQFNKEILPTNKKVLLICEQ